MPNVEKRYEKKGRIKPCCLDKNDLVQLTKIIQETFSKPEVERYFKVSTTFGETRVFSNSMEDFLQQKGLPKKITELAFWIEGWEEESRFDKNVLLDFSQSAIQLSVEGTDPVWVYDKYNKIVKFLSTKTAWYWPIITLERFLIFITTLILISNVILSFGKRERFIYIDEAILIGLWIFLVFFDTRKIWPYPNIVVTGEKSIFSKENVATIIILLLLMASLMVGTIFPLLR